MPQDSTLKRPAAKLIYKFDVSQVGNDTIRTFLEIVRESSSGPLRSFNGGSVKRSTSVSPILCLA